MKRIEGWVALIVFGLALAGPARLHAGSTSKHPETPAAAQKESKSYDKQIRKGQKEQNKAAKKQNKDWAKLHPGVPQGHHK